MGLEIFCGVSVRSVYSVGKKLRLIKKATTVIYPADIGDCAEISQMSVTTKVDLIIHAFNSVEFL